MSANQTISSYLLQENDGDALNSASDKKLLKWMRSGNTSAFEQLFFRYETRLIAYATRYTSSPDLAKDVCQEVFLKLISKPPRVLICDSLAPWLFRVTRNLSIDKCRSRKFEIHEHDTMGVEAKAEGDPLQSLRDKNDAEVVRDLVNSLPPQLRDVVELRIDGGVSFKEIAVILRIPQGTALWRMHRAVKVLRKGWKGYEEQV